ncbi:hypothetical protein [Actinomadura sp. SCN-SB]
MSPCPNCGEPSSDYVHPECHEEYVAYLDGEAAPAPDRDDRDEGEPT